MKYIKDNKKTDTKVRNISYKELIWGLTHFRVQYR